VGAVLVQSKTVTVVATSTSLSFDSTPSVGNTVLVELWCFGSQATPTGSDNQGGSNSYTRDVIKQSTAPQAAVVIFRALLSASSGTFTVTLSNVTFSDSISLVIMEFSGILSVSPIDGSNSANGSSTAPAPGSITTTNIPDVLLAVVGSDVSNANTITASPGGGYISLLKNINSTGAQSAGEAMYQIVSSTGSFNPTWTTVSGAWAAGQIAYKAIGGTVDQESFRFRNDDGSESAATWLNTQDTNASKDNLTNVRLRVIVNSTGDYPSSAFQLEVRKVGATTWNKVTIVGA
jgi:hypothetical protein